MLLDVLCHGEGHVTMMRDCSDPQRLHTCSQASRHRTLEPLLSQKGQG